MWKFPTLFAMLLLLSLIAGPASAQLEQLAKLQAANRAMYDVATARLNLERFHFDLIKKLQENGHASWVELARQEVLVETLDGQQQSLASFSQFVDEVVFEVDKRNIAPGPSRNPIKLYRPDSRRLVGWIERERASEIARASSLSLNSEKKSVDESVMHAASDRLQKAELQIRNFVHSESAPHHWGEQARLIRDLAQAELNLLQLQNQINERIAPSMVYANSNGIDKAIDLTKRHHSEFLHAASNSELQNATWSVAAAEAGARGGLQLAEMELQRLNYQAVALERLHARNLAYDEQLRSVKDKIEVAEMRRELERERITREELIANSLNSGPTPNPEKMALSNQFEFVPPGQWPDRILADTDRLLHLIELRRDYYSLDGQVNSAIAQRELQSQYLKRLNAIVEQSPATDPNLQLDGAAGQLNEVLESGERHQIDLLELGIAAHDARILDANEQRFILSLEERRFILQCQQQDVMAAESRVSVPVAFQGVGTSPVGGKTNPLAPVSYFESAAPGDSNADLVFDPGWRPQYFTFELAKRSSMPILAVHSPLVTPGLLSTFAGKSQTMYDYEKSSIVPPDSNSGRQFGTDVPFHGWFVNDSGIWPGTWSTQAMYPNGALRSDLRYRLPAGYPPWYVPGSPTNLQR